MMIVKATKDSEAGVMPSEKLLGEMAKYNEQLVKAGVMLDGSGLKPSSKGARIKYSGSKRTVVDGPFAETKELVAGFWVIQVKSKEEAVEWAKRVPFEDGEVELRPFFELEDFAPGPAIEHHRRIGEELGKQKSWLRRWVEDGVIGSRDGYRHPSRHRRGVAHRIPENHCRAGAHGARRWPGGRSCTRCARGRARAVARIGYPEQRRGLAYGHRQASRD
jgi:hypothetical protein